MERGDTQMLWVVLVIFLFIFLWLLLDNLFGDTVAIGIILSLLAIVLVYLISFHLKVVLIILAILGIGLLVKKFLTNKTVTVKVVTFICVVLCTAGAVLFLTLDFQKMELQKILKFYGFENAVIVKSLIDDSKNIRDYKISFEDLNNADYDMLLQMAGEIEEARQSWQVHNIFANIWYYCGEDEYSFNLKDRKVEKNYREVYSDYFNSEGYLEDIEIDRKLAEEKREMDSLYGDKYPEIGMPEAALEYTKLGPPSRIEQSRDFSSKRPSVRHKVYYWDETPEHGQWSVHISYGGWDSRWKKMLTYLEGKVTSITYFDEDGFHKVS